MKIFPLFLVISFFVSCQSSVSSREFTSKKLIVIDTDMGNDDWMALLYLLKHPKADIKGITVNGVGLSEVNPALQHAVKLQEIAGTIQNKAIPLAKGPVKAWKQTNPYPEEFRKPTNEFFKMDREIHHPLNLQRESAAEFLVRLTKDVKDLEVLALGSLTNIADAIKLDSNFIERVKRLVVMGGAIDAQGNVHVAGHSENTFAEFNIFADPEAANFVFKSGIKIDLVTLDSTNLVPINATLVDRFKKRESTAALKTILHIFDHIKKDLIDPGYFYAWDPLAAVALMEEGFYQWKEVSLTVNTQPGKHYGQTLRDPKGSKVFFLVPRDGFDLSKEWESHYLNVIAPHNE